MSDFGRHHPGFGPATLFPPSMYNLYHTLHFRKSHQPYFDATSNNMSVSSWSAELVLDQRIRAHQSLLSHETCCQDHDLARRDTYFFESATPGIRYLFTPSWKLTLHDPAWAATFCKSRAQRPGYLGAGSLICWISPTSLEIGWLLCYIRTWVTDRGRSLLRITAEYLEQEEIFIFHRFYPGGSETPGIPSGRDSRSMGLFQPYVGDARGSYPCFLHQVSRRGAEYTGWLWDNQWDHSSIAIHQSYQKGNV